MHTSRNLSPSGYVMDCSLCFKSLYLHTVIQLVGGLEYILFFQIHRVIIPIDQYFSEGVKPNQAIVLLFDHRLPFLQDTPPAPETKPAVKAGLPVQRLCKCPFQVNVFRFRANLFMDLAPHRYPLCWDGDVLK